MCKRNQYCSLVSYLALLLQVMAARDDDKQSIPELIYDGGANVTYKKGRFFGKVLMCFSVSWLRYIYFVLTEVVFLDSWFNVYCFNGLYPKSLNLNMLPLFLPGWFCKVLRDNRYKDWQCVCW